MENKIYDFGKTVEAIERWYRRHPEALTAEGEGENINPKFDRKCVFIIEDIKFIIKMHVYRVGYTYTVYEKGREVFSSLDYIDTDTYPVYMCRTQQMIKYITRECSTRAAAITKNRERVKRRLTKKCIDYETAKKLKALLFKQ